MQDAQVWNVIGYHTGRFSERRRQGGWNRICPGMQIVAGTGHTIIYRSGINPKIHRNFEVFTPCDFIAAITQHIPDKSFQLVRYYGWYRNRDVEVTPA